MDALLTPQRPEFLIDLGGFITRQQRLGVSLYALARRWRVSTDVLRLAVAFSESSDKLKLRAMVEDWPLDRIATALRDSESDASIETIGAAHTRQPV